MGSEWRELPFTEAVQVNPKVSLKRGQVYPFVDMKAVDPSWRNASESEYRVFKNGGARFMPYDTLMARITPCLENGKIARYIPIINGSGPAFGSTEFIVIRGREGVTNNDFAYYLTKWQEFRQFAIAQMTGSSGRQRVPADSLAGFSVPVPELDEQRAIAHILGTLDDKIELNRQMNRTLEKMAQAIFKSWFIDFDPVRAKAEGRDPGLPKEIADLFPDSFGDSELGPIPKGWEVGCVADLGEVICGKTPPTKNPENYGKDIPFVTIPDMHGKVYVTETGKSLSKKGADTQKNKYLPPHSVCVSCIATPGLVVLTSKEVQTNQQINSVIPTKLSPFYIYGLLHRLGDQIRAGGSGGSVFANLNKSRFSALKVLLANENCIKSFHGVVEPLYRCILENQKESSVIFNLRDTLLPKLISGELRVPDAEKLVEGVV